MPISGNNPFQNMLMNRIGQGGGGGGSPEEEMFDQAFGGEAQAFENMLQGFPDGQGGNMRDFMQMQPHGFGSDFQNFGQALQNVGGSQGITSLIGENGELPELMFQTALGGEGQDPMQGFMQLIQQRQAQMFGTQAGATGDPIQDMFNIAQQSGIMPQGATLEGVGRGNFEQYLEAVLQNGLASGAIGQQTVLDSSNSALLNSAIQQLGMQLGLDINQWANEANIDLDLNNLQTRANYGVFMKQVEQYLLDQQVKEKLENLFFDLEKTKMQNRFSLAKTAAGAARYG